MLNIALANILSAKPEAGLPRAKRIIYLFQNGGPSQLDMFCYKPMLEKFAGQPLPESLQKNQSATFIDTNAAVLASRFSWSQDRYGNWYSDPAKPLMKVADDLLFLHNVKTDVVNHGPAQTMLHTGMPIPGRPSLGSWISYGLGSEAKDLPDYVVLNSGRPSFGGMSLYGSGFLPAELQGVPFAGTGEPVPYLDYPRDITTSDQQQVVQRIAKLNQVHFNQFRDPKIIARTKAMELAAQMQLSIPDLLDLSEESTDTLELYGADPQVHSFARNCLYARRLLERGSRIVHLVNGDWDMHTAVHSGTEHQCELSMRPIAGLITDLKRCGLLDDTLVVWGGEFGRTPQTEVSPLGYKEVGRDHHPDAFTMFLAGAGIQGGRAIGQTDDFGMYATDGSTHIHDLNATILHLLGFDHEKLTYRAEGREFRLTDVHGTVMENV